MATYDLTPEIKVIPDKSLWGQNAAIGLPVSEQHDLHTETLRNLEYLYGIDVRLDSSNIHDTVWTTPIMQKIYNASYPLGRLLGSQTTIIITKEWLGYWELYSRCFVGPITQRIKNRIASSQNKARERAILRKELGTEAVAGVNIKSIPLRSFHIMDIDKNSITSIMKSMNRIEYVSGKQINWNWVATYSPDAVVDHTDHLKDKDRWSSGIGDDGAVSSANMRAWRNKIQTQLKVVDIIVGNSNSENDTINTIAFTLINLATGGYAYIFIPRIASASIVSMIHLFSHCFEKTQIVHLVAEDKLYLCGEGFLSNLKTYHHNMLYDFCSGNVGASNMTPFSPEYVRGDKFIFTMDALVNINASIHTWRYEYYEKLLIANRELSKSASARTFEKFINTYLAEHFKDDSDQWVSATAFKFFVDKNA